MLLLIFYRLFPLVNGKTCCVLLESLAHFIPSKIIHRFYLRTNPVSPLHYSGNSLQPLLVWMFCPIVCRSFSSELGSVCSNGRSVLCAHISFYGPLGRSKYSVFYCSTWVRNPYFIVFHLEKLPGSYIFSEVLSFSDLFYVNITMEIIYYSGRGILWNYVYRFQ